MPRSGKGGVMEKKKVKIEEKVTCGILAERLRKMALDLENGRFEVQSGDETISFSYAESIPMEIEAKQKDNKEKLVIEMSWRTPTVPAEAAKALDEPETAMDSASSEPTCGVETAPPPAEAVPEGSPQVPEQTEGTMLTEHCEPPAAVEVNPLPEEAAGDESDSSVSAPAGVEKAEPSGAAAKPRAGRSRRK